MAPKSLEEGDDESFQEISALRTMEKVMSVKTDGSMKISMESSIQEVFLPGASTLPDMSEKESSLRGGSNGDFNFENWLVKRSQNRERCRRTKIGVAFRNLNVYGFNTPTDYQKTVSNYAFVVYNEIRQWFGHKQKMRVDILRDFEGVVRSGEMLVVLGKPGSGCTTFLKTISGQTYGFYVDPSSQLNYQGTPKGQGHGFESDSS